MAGGAELPPVSERRPPSCGVYVVPELMRLLADFADRREQSRSLIAEAPIASFLSPDADERQEAAIAKRPDRIDHNIQRSNATSASPTKPPPSSYASG